MRAQFWVYCKAQKHSIVSAHRFARFYNSAHTGKFNTHTKPRWLHTQTHTLIQIQLEPASCCECWPCRCKAFLVCWVLASLPCLHVTIHTNKIHTNAHMHTHTAQQLAWADVTITYEQNPNCFRSSVSLNSVNASLCVHHRQRKIVCVFVCACSCQACTNSLNASWGVAQSCISLWMGHWFDAKSISPPPSLSQYTHTPPIQLLKALYG